MQIDYNRHVRQQGEVSENSAKHVYDVQRRSEVQHEEKISVEILRQECAIKVAECLKKGFRL